MPIQSRAAVFYAPHEKLRIETVDVADPGPHEVLIKLAATGLCHSDLHFIEGDLAHPVPAVLGHEGMGTVLRTGPNVTEVAEGDRVIPYLVPDCGVCPYCRSGKTNNCQQMGRAYAPDYKSWISLGGRPIRSLLGLGTFSEYIVVPEDQVQRVHADAPADQACCIACGVTTGLGAVLITANVEAGSTVVVYGLGGVGLSVIQGARIAGAARIVGVDVNSDKEPVAKAHGATHFLNGRECDPVAEIMKLTGIGADYAFECVGLPKLFEQTLGCLNRGWGKAISVGVIADRVPVPITWSQLSGRSWQRSFMGGAKRRDMAGYVDWFVEGKVKLDQLVSHRITLDQINDGFDLMRQGRAARVVVVYD